MATTRLHVALRRSGGYDILLGMPMDAVARDLAVRPLGRTHFVISDANVARLHAKHFVSRLRRHDLEAYLLVVPAGERSKSRAMKERLEDRLLALGAHRDSVVVALGGGMIGDLAGFTAATLHRGVPLVQVPTSLLAQVDSSVGGKVAVDHPRGKNLVGAFHQPARVYIDVGALRTLPGEEYRSGLAEVIKYGATMDAKLFALLKAKARSIAGNAPGTMTPIIRRCCDLKRMIVEADERESGLRRILNFGHTIGHAVETLSNYRLRHGYAVAIGMCAEGRIGVALGITGRDSADRLEALVRLYGLPTEIPSRFTTGSILKATRLDKKSFGGAIRYTLLRAIGASELNVVVPERDLRSLLGSLRRR